MNHPVIGSISENMRIQIGSNHFPTLRKLPEGWILDTKPDRMPLLGIAVGILFSLFIIRQVFP